MLCQRLLRQRGQNPVNWLCELEPMITAAGFQESSAVPHIVNYSYGVPMHEDWKRDLMLWTRKWLPQMIELGLITQEAALSLGERVQREMSFPNFHALQHFLTVWGRKS
ncbi:hypothetical protein [Ktedonosporobacter rubrisoli]|nr:hypothetical protein [Ktedonosporobacter rubrisoli]